MAGVFSHAHSHPTDPIAHFVRILQGLMASLLRAPKTRATSASLLETLLWHLDYFLRRLTAPNRARKSNPKPAKPCAHPTPRPNPNHTPGMLMRCPAWLPHLAPSYLPDAVADIDSATAALATLLASSAIEPLITQSPTIARTLRALCRMFGLAPPTCLARPKPIPKPKPPKPKHPRKPRDYGYTLVGFRNPMPHLGLGPPRTKPR